MKAREWEEETWGKIELAMKNRGGKWREIQ